MWKERLHSLRGSLDLKGGDLAAFLLSLFLAISIWLIHNLSLNYSDNMSVPVIAECNIEGHSNISSNANVIVARCRTSGYNLLRNQRAGNRPAITVHFNSSDMHLKEGDVFYITNAELSNYVNDIFGDGISLESFVSETVQFRFPVENNKKVPVQVVNLLSFKPQYMAMEEMKVQPDSVTVYGEPLHIDKLDRVLTKTVELSDLRSSAHGVVKLEPINGVRLSTNEVKYSLDVTRYVELQTEVSLVARNVPSGRILSIFPSTAKVVYKCAFPLSDDPTDKVSFYIDYNDFESSIGGKCIARSTEIPGGVIEYSIEPEVFDCVEEVR